MVDYFCPKPNKTISTYFKKYYAEYAKHIPVGHITESDLEYSALKNIGLTADIINYVRTNYVNTENDPYWRLLREGFRIWRETYNRMKRHEDKESTCIHGKILIMFIRYSNTK